MSLVQCPTPGSSNACHLLDGMPDSAAAAGEDRIGALPDDILRLVLSFLPSRESMCTCVLARRWRNLWKSVPTVLIYDEEEARFVTSLLLLRDRVPLRVFVFTSFLHETPQDVEIWLRYAASCHVRVLQLEVESYDTTARLRLPNMTLVCQHLKTLYICSVKLEERTLDFSSCPVLEKLLMVNCEIHVEKILCQSLRRLVTFMCIFVADARTRISCPSLAALELAQNVGLTPFLESMPSLVTAFVEFDREWSEREELYDHCLDGGYYVGCGEWDCLPCHHIDREGDDCVLLDGLCGATKLTLISAPTMQQPIDRKDETYGPRKQFLVSKNLKVVKIKHRKNDERIHQIVIILVSLGVAPENINCSDCINF
ncbi:hypothetical protein ACQ4PT_036206 [Festuca glaucescens]